MKEQPITDRIDLENATPEFVYKWNMIRLTYRPITYVPIFYAGAIAGSEFSVFSANKLYFALNLTLDYVGDLAGSGATQLMDITNNPYKWCGNILPWWNGAAIRYFHSEYNISGAHFSRIAFGNYTNVIFSGYRLTI